MPEPNMPLTEDEALELLAYLLTSAQGCINQPPDYSVLRIVSAADRMARTWAPRASGDLAAYLEELGTRMPTEAARMDVDMEGFTTYLAEQVRVLAKIVKQRTVESEATYDS
jgi:hypothetical protein